MANIARQRLMTHYIRRRALFAQFCSDSRTQPLLRAHRVILVAWSAFRNCEFRIVPWTVQSMLWLDQVPHIRILRSQLFLPDAELFFHALCVSLGSHTCRRSEQWTQVTRLLVKEARVQMDVLWRDGRRRRLCCWHQLTRNVDLFDAWQFRLLQALIKLERHLIVPFQAAHAADR